jgi:hypothetical protein
MTIDGLQKRRLIVCWNMFPNLETKNSIHGRPDKGRVCQVRNRAIRKGRGEWISIVSRCIETCLAEDPDVVAQSTTKIIKSAYAVLAC